MAGYPAAPALGPPPPPLMLLFRNMSPSEPTNRMPKVPAFCMRLSVIHTGCPKSPCPRMASALWEVNRLPLSRKAAGVAGTLVRVTLAPWTPPLMVESVTEIAVLLEKRPSVFVEASVLRETTRPKLDEPLVEVAPFMMLMPVVAYRTEAFTNDPFAALPDKLMPAQSPGAAD